MIFLSTTPRYARTSYRVRLEPHETAYTDSRLITLADRGGRLTDPEWEAIAKGQAHPGHFGGEVRRYGDELQIEVYVD